jgi:hypothetical protein
MMIARANANTLGSVVRVFPRLWMDATFIVVPPFVEVDSILHSIDCSSVPVSLFLFSRLLSLNEISPKLIQ